VKVIMTDSTGGFDKAGSGGNNLLTRQLIGEGLVGITGEKWARHRRVIAPSFNMERVKVRTSLHFTFRDIKLVIFLINDFSLSTAV
jgi:cytochrome P450